MDPRQSGHGRKPGHSVPQRRSVVPLLPAAGGTRVSLQNPGAVFRHVLQPSERTGDDCSVQQGVRMPQTKATGLNKTQSCMYVSVVFRMAHTTHELTALNEKQRTTFPSLPPSLLSFLPLSARFLPPLKMPSRLSSCTGGAAAARRSGSKSSTRTSPSSSRARSTLRQS